MFFTTNSSVIGSSYQLTMEKGGDEGNGPNVSDALFGHYVHVFLLLTHVL